MAIKLGDVAILTEYRGHNSTRNFAKIGGKWTVNQILSENSFKAQPDDCGFSYTFFRSNGKTFISGANSVTIKISNREESG